ncbi:MAG: sugar phosphate isomerase/epimerase [Desulfobacteraceae bacterium]|nr:sugar phosphate isomerase/epimerase [Pseudomonadota bacterium]MBU4462887.1 sugar phosphate isomerase/epimerase [Pseudomonadota bacterium]MCG2755220.1 sugar phosphate isomerase/epimerase [Desulfobacteraceae bacterium]
MLNYHAEISILPKSYKRAYPFRLGTTSFIYPDHIIPNVKMLAPYFDEIELLLFESNFDSLPTIQQIRELALLAEQFDLTYNIHLPIDISISDSNASVRRSAVDTLKRTIGLTSYLSPSTYTLHISYDEDSRDKESVNRWQELVYKSVDELLRTGIQNQTISVETLSYPFDWLEEIIKTFRLSVCIDIGHLLVNGFDVKKVFDKHSGNTSIIHLHGVGNKKDHVSLNMLPLEQMDQIIGILKRYYGVVSLEVFSFENLTTSLTFLEKYWKNSDI